MTNIIRKSLTNKRLQPLLAAAAMSVLIVGCTPSGNDDAASSSSSSRRAPASARSSTAPASQAAMKDDQMYADGTYEASGTYRSPAGGEQVNISLTLKNGVITASTFEGTATNPKSVKMQEAFATGYKEMVVGKSIDDVALTVVNGSSLTGAGFMDAVAKIKAKAKA